MNKKTLTAQVAQKTGMTKTEATRVFEAVVDTLISSFEQGDNITIQGFGTLAVKERRERKGVNPSTKKPMTIKSRKVVKFTLSKNVKLD